MKPLPRIGDSAAVEIIVDESMCPAFDGIIIHRVYSTWSLAHHMELAARKVLVPCLEPHEEGIGGHLSIDHLAPTPVGHSVRVTARAVEVDPSTLVCEIEAHHLREDGPRLVARGRQVQRVLPRARLEALFRRAAGAAGEGDR